ncbi:hypothetical protein [Flavihumibacter fluvii]|uniref:hypothetical protein n=1 Tax=Flavihumibacter fluvii TaxID=2838157 RepID=UPI001BDF188C|nr:hypothetical protein [Flavihumibacter fluvii]ULQ52652.1 hypothetical protein KJS93_21420 [Flavihumibacter fluvii]
MKDKTEISEKITEVLNSLEGIQRATASPFLFEKMQGRRNEDNGIWNILAYKLSRPAVAISLSLVILLVNTWLLLSNPDAGNVPNTDQISDLAIDYHFDASTAPEQNMILP